MPKSSKKESSIAFGRIFSVIADVLSVVSWLGLSFSALLSFFRGNYYLLIFSGICIFLLLCLHICKKKQISIIKYIMNMFAYNMKYSIEEWTAQYEYHTETTMSFRTTYLV